MASLVPKEKSNLAIGFLQIVISGIIYRIKTGCQWRAIPIFRKRI
ncbi:hypothetical protein LEP1GSC082_1095 [Leptospira kirschneri str. H2]|nr:hypothetical protein LEP1GSC082_1095 [Leptospira kirschneri str. H2]